MQQALKVNTILYGGDYNPEQWPETEWSKDMKLLQEAGINSVTLNVFSWSQLQPSEYEYDFSQLDKIVRLASDNQMKIVLATSTGAVPPWLAIRYPEVTRTELDGRKMQHGRRHNVCINSPIFRKYSKKLAGKLARRYGGEKELVAWHISNEYSGFCYCLEYCAPAFREWLKNKYGSLTEVNKAWNSAIWSHTYHNWNEINPPNLLNDILDRGSPVGLKAVLPGAALDYRRFYGSQVLKSFQEEKAAIRQFDSVHPVTTNWIGRQFEYDIFDWSDSLDINSWDSYPAYDGDSLQVRFRHDLMRAVGKGQPFMLMEQTPSRQNWHPYNSQKRPGQLRQQSWQAISRGADTIQYFQLRQSAGGCEKFHGAVIEGGLGSQRRQFREVAALGAELSKFGPQIVGSNVEPARVALVFDWPSWWGISFSAGPSASLDYLAEAQRWHNEYARRGIPLDIISRHANFAEYDVIVAPCLYIMPDDVAANLRAFVSGGGRLVLTPMSALVGESDLLFQGEQPVPFRNLAGIWIEETDALPPNHHVPLSFGGAGEILCDIVHADPGTEVLATYRSEYYAGTPALTYQPSVTASGKSFTGGLYYMATFPNREALRLVVDSILNDTGISGFELPDGVEVSRRIHPDGRVLTFLINSNNSPIALKVPGVSGTDLLTTAPVNESFNLEPYGVAVIA